MKTVKVSDAKVGEDEELLASLKRRGVIRRGKRGAFPRELLVPGPADPKRKVLGSLLAERRRSREVLGVVSRKAAKAQRAGRLLSPAD